MTQMSKFLIISLVFYTFPFKSHGQDKIPTINTIKTAQLLERKGDIEGAISIYKDILTRNPKHRQSIQNLKSIYLKNFMYDRGIQFIRGLITKEPNDVRTYCELGELYFLNKQKKEANVIWYAGLNKFKYNRSFYRIMLSTLAKYNLGEDLSSFIKKGRENFGQSFLSYEFGTYSQSIEDYDNAMDEFITHLINEKNYQSIIERKILLMSDEEEAIPIIEKKLLKASELYPNPILNILSEFYFKQQKYNLSIQTKKDWTIKGNKDFSDWIKFANDFRNEGQYQHAIDAYYFVLSYKLNPKLTEKALLGLGQTFDDQITSPKNLYLIPYFYDNNMFFKNPFQEYSSISTKYLESSLNLYDSLLVSLKKPSFLSEAYFRLGEIHYKILQDFDKAYYLLNKSMNYRSDKNTTLKIINRTADVLLAMGQTEEALKFLQTELGTDPSIGLNEKIILIQFLTNTPDSILNNIELSLEKIGPADPSFNDLMELKNIIVKYCSKPIDSLAFKHFQKSELLIRQKKLGNSVKELEYLVNNFSESNMIPLVHLRLAIVNFQLANYDAALNYAFLLENTEFVDKGIILTGQINEIQGKDIEICLKQYMRILNDFTFSIYREPIRYHVRTIQKTES